MKKTAAILLALLLLLTGCSGKQGPTVMPQTEQTHAGPTESTAPETIAPETIATRAMGEAIPIILGFLKKGETVEVIGYAGSFAQVRTDLGEGLAETRLLRFADEPFESFTAYALWNAGLYSDDSCLNAPLENLPTNTPMTVLEELGNCYYVNCNGKTGFVLANQLSRNPYVPQPEKDGSNGSGSSSGSGSSGGSGPQDGGDISLRFPGALRFLADMEKTGAASAKVDGVPLVIGLCKLGQKVDALENVTAPEGYTAVREESGTAYFPTQWLEFSKDFTPWEGYAGVSCKLYGDYRLYGDPMKTVSVNTRVTVLWDGGTVSLVQVDNACYYASSETVTQVPTQIAPATEATDPPASGSGSTDLWTPPVM